jgi:hypothetical protein
MSLLVGIGAEYALIPALQAFKDSEYFKQIDLKG